MLTVLIASMGAGRFIPPRSQRMWPYFHNMTLVAVIEAALLIVHSLPVEHIQPALAPSACGHEDSSVCLLYKNAHKQIALKPFMRP